MKNPMVYAFLGQLAKLREAMRYEGTALERHKIMKNLC